MKLNLLTMAAAIGALGSMPMAQSGGGSSNQIENHDNDGVKTGDAQTAAATLQHAGFSPLTEEQVKYCQTGMLETLLMFCPNDRAKVITREYWQTAQDTGIEAEYGGLGGIRFLAADIDAGISAGEWPWTAELSKSQQSQAALDNEQKQQNTSAPLKAAS